jgi:hypothetical protein
MTGHAFLDERPAEGLACRCGFIAVTASDVESVWVAHVAGASSIAEPPYGKGEEQMVVMACGCLTMTDRPTYAHVADLKGYLFECERHSTKTCFHPNIDERNWPIWERSSCPVEMM